MVGEDMKCHIDRLRAFMKVLEKCGCNDVSGGDE